MKNWKAWSIFAMLLLVFTMIVGCSKDDAKTTTTEPKDDTDEQTTNEVSKDPVTISYWHIYSDGPMKDTMTEIINEFENQHPEIKVDELGINFWDYWTKLSTAMAGGSGPDLALNDTSTLQARAKSGAILNIDSLIEKNNLNTDVFFPVLTEKMKYQDSFYGLPSDTDVRVLYYNKAHFREVGLDPEKPPTNWAELEEYADKLTKWNSKKLLDRVGFAPSTGNLHMWTLAWGNGGDFWDDEGNPTYTKPENLEALEWIKKMQDKYGVKAMSAFNSQASSLQYSPFIAGKVSMVVDVNNLYTDIQRYAPDMEFGVAAIPYQKEPATWSAGFDYELTNNKDDKRAEAAFELLKYLTSAEVQVKIHEVSGSLVSNMEAAKDPKFMEDPIWKLMVEQMDHSRFIEYIDALPSWHANLDPVEQSVVNSGVDPKKALEEAQTAAENAVKNH